MQLFNQNAWFKLIWERTIQIIKRAAPETKNSIKIIDTVLQCDHHTLQMSTYSLQVANYDLQMVT